MAIIVTDTTTNLDKDGNLVDQIIQEKSIQKDQEPDYIKIYTAMFFEFKQFPTQYRELFLQLAMHMTYCNTEDLEGSQIVCVSGHVKKMIMEACGWINDSSLARGLKKLCDCGAIRRTGKGEYQINPQFAGKGAWRYNNKLKQGGIKDLVANFHFATGSVKTAFVFDDEIEDEYNAPDQVTYVAASPSEQEVIASMSGSSSPTKHDPYSP